MPPASRICLIISADAEWRATLALFAPAHCTPSPFGDWFTLDDTASGAEVICFNGGWGKIAAAASAQYAIDRWRPDLLVNLGTCGGFAGRIDRGTILLAERTVIYDIIELMGSQDLAIEHYAVDHDLSWIPDSLAAIFEAGAASVMAQLFAALPEWIAAFVLRGHTDEHGPQRI